MNNDTEPHPGNKVILVVDDEPDILRLVNSMLSDQYDVIPASSAESAIQLFDSPSKRPDLVLADVVMPGMSGPMLVDQLLTIKPDLRVLFMSGFDDRQVVQKYVVDRGFRLIPKPFTARTLLTTIKEVLSVAQVGRPRGEPAA
jgi:two-component system, cell cycle sensor histidine kinase and response regulator CckA